MFEDRIQPILALQQIKGYGNKTVTKILHEFPKVDVSSPVELLNLLNQITEKIKIPTIDIITESWNKSMEIIAISKQNEIEIISQNNPKYPKTLLRIENPPILLHIKGNMDSLKMDSVAIVGTRRPTDYGVKNAQSLTKSFADEGYCIVSGLAEGVDSTVHKSTLAAKGITIAVLPHGLDTIYPSKNRQLAEDILENDGALITEYPIYTRFNKSHFIQRDRIQSGLSLSTIVIETNIDGGTMHTAKYCREQKRELFVLKHPSAFKDNPAIQGNLKLLSETSNPLTEETRIDNIIIKLNKVKGQLIEIRNDSTKSQKQLHECRL